MTEFIFRICDYCTHKKCVAYTCNMREELEGKLLDRFDDLLDAELPMMMKEWKQSNRIVKEP